MEESEDDSTDYGDEDEEFSHAQSVIFDKNGKKIVSGDKDEDGDNDNDYVPEGDENDDQHDDGDDRYEVVMT